jgi:dihydrofolate reductase / thymidylate synthase
MSSRCNIIVAKDLANIIGFKNDLVYRIPTDMKFFNGMTKNVSQHVQQKNKLRVQNAVVMGHNTWRSIPNKFRPLCDRHNMILTKNNYEFVKNSVDTIPNVSVSNDLSTGIRALNANKSVNEVFIVGGENIYREALENDEIEVDKLFLTEIDYDIRNSEYFKNNDVNSEHVSFFPDIEELIKNDYNLVSSIPITEKATVFPRFADCKQILPLKYNFQVYQRNPSKQVFMNFVESIEKNHPEVIPNKEEYQYLNQLRDALDNGNIRPTRNSVTKSKFGVKMSFDLSKDNTIPLLTTKRMPWKMIIKELLWFISGATDNKTLQDQKVHIWDGNTTREFLDNRGLTHLPEGDIGAGYGFQWRHIGAEYVDCKTDYAGQGIDQLRECINQIKNDPTSRRIILTGWNPIDLDKMALPPCHMMQQWYVTEDGKLCLQMYQRSGDSFLGIPFNIFSYAVMIRMMAQVTGLQPGTLHHVVGDFHVYDDHKEAIEKQLSRVPHKFPTLTINPDKMDIDDFVMDDFELHDYDYYPTIKAPMIA